MKFYVLIDPDVEIHQSLAITDFIKLEPHIVGEAPKCPLCGSFTGALSWLSPRNAEIEVWGDVYGDIVFGSGNCLFVSQRFIDLYKISGLIGLDGFHEVNVTKVIRRGGSKVKKEPPKYYCVSISRSRALIDTEASEFVHEEPWTCPECKSGLIKRAKRIFLEKDTWSGEDIFYARGLPGTIIVSQRFKDFFDKYKINNGVLIPAEEYSFDYYPWEDMQQETI
ncbi:MAG: hypothetical protein JW804_00030 [Sedimentisphaerales bacterium]|nr:hypothetical protein [Sedimentisphaerales bacterium]